MANNNSFKGIGYADMKDFLDEKYYQYNQPEFIQNDPVSIPHLFTKKQDIEISGFLTASIAWGRRDLIIDAAQKLIRMMGNRPHEFLINANEKAIDEFGSFYYRTLKGTDCRFFIYSLQKIYQKYDCLEDVFKESVKSGKSLKNSILYFREIFFNPEHEERTRKHFADIGRGAAGKRLNMFMRWMVRNDGRGVDFGIWNSIKSKELYMPVDLHSGNSARKLGLLTRNQNDWKAVEELTDVLKQFDANDPVKYDYSLFGLGVSEKF